MYTLTKYIFLSILKHLYSKYNNTLFKSTLRNSLWLQKNSYKKGYRTRMR